MDASGRLAPEAIERTLEATREYAEIITSLNADRIRYCATSAARDAENAEDFAVAVHDILGVRPEVLSGTDEARASFLGATRGLGATAGDAMVVDIGGGSTELVVGRDEAVAWSVSLDVGSVRLTERFLASDPPTGVFRTMWRHRQVLARLGVAAALLSSIRSARQVVLPLWGVSIGLDAQTIAIVVGISGALDFALFYASGQVMDRFGRLWAALPAMILMGTGFLALAFTHHSRKKKPKS